MDNNKEKSLEKNCNDFEFKKEDNSLNLSLLETKILKLLNLVSFLKEENKKLNTELQNSINECAKKDAQILALEDLLESESKNLEDKSNERIKIKCAVSDLIDSIDKLKLIEEDK